MVTVTVKKTRGAKTARTSISAPSIEEAVRIAGEGAHLEFPIDGGLFFAPTTADGAETLYETSLPTSGEIARWSAA